MITIAKMNLPSWIITTFLFSILWAAKSEAAARLGENVSTLSLEETEIVTSASSSTETLKQLEPEEVSTENTNHVSNEEKHDHNDEPVDEQKNLDKSTLNSTDSNSNSTKSNGKVKLGCHWHRKNVHYVHYQPPPPPKVQIQRVVEKVPVYYPVNQYVPVRYPSYPRNPCYGQGCHHSGYYQPRKNPCYGQNCNRSGYYQRPQRQVQNKKPNKGISYEMMPKFGPNYQQRSQGYE